MAKFSRNQMSMSKPDFQRVFKSGQKSADAQLVILARPNGLAISRLGLAIAKKYTPRAVDRNRIKRLIRESFMHHQPFNISIDAVVINRTAITQKNNQQVFQSLANHWQRISSKLEQQGI